MHHQVLNYSLILKGEIVLFLLKNEQTLERQQGNYSIKNQGEAKERGCVIKVKEETSLNEVEYSCLDQNNMTDS